MPHGGGRLRLSGEDAGGRHGGLSHFLGEILLALPGVKETRTYAVMEEVKSDGMSAGVKTEAVRLSPLLTFLNLA